ncbi:peptidoglycan-binding protein [Streptomyces sp. NPDC057363]|uniref:peptidoglycan-binding domain-containing protein n=1 Tax=Streptomyces sp. NPDC057363 TaxID=3346107 RepID=UPI003628AF44
MERKGASLTAGYSDTRRTYLHQLVISWDVVEAQCLLEYHGYPVAEVDGAYDAMTERAVKRFQEDRGGLVVDGIIGEHTWEVLRR